MGIASVGLINFTAGETSPLLDGRNDLSKYYNSCREMMNMISTPWGPATRRPGTRYINDLKSSTASARLFNFEFSDEQAYVLETGAAYFRFFKDRGRIVVADTDAAISNGTMTGNITGWSDISVASGAISHDATNDRLNLTPGGTGTADAAAEQSVSVGASYQAVEHVLVFRVVGLAGDRVQVQIGATTGAADVLAATDVAVGWHAVAFTPAAGTVYVQFHNLGATNNKLVQIDDVALLDNAALELTHGWTQNQLSGIRWAQSADTMYLVHPQVPQMKLLRYGHTTWSLEEISFTDGPYQDENITGTTLAPASTTGYGISVTASSTEGINSGGGFKSTDVGRSLRIKHAGTWGWGRIASVTSATVVVIDIKGDFGATTAQAAWQLGAWSATTGYPSAVNFHEERLIFGGIAIAQPQRIDGSLSGDFENFTPGVGDGDAIAYNMASNKVHNIRWLVSGKTLLVGTRSGEAKVSASTLETPLTPTNAQPKFDTKHGSADVAPIEVSNAVLFLQSARRKVRELAYTIEADGFKAPDMTILAEHITETGLCELAYQQEPWSVVWACRGDGVLVGFTYMRDEDVTAWHPHRIGGTLDGEVAKVESVITIPGAAGDELWMIVKRTINGATKRYIEVMESKIDYPRPKDYTAAAGLLDASAHTQALLTRQMDAFHVDSGLTFDVPITISGVTQGNPAVVTTNIAHNLSAGDELRLTEVLGMTEVNLISYTAANVTATTVELQDSSGVNIDSTAFTAYVTGGKLRKKQTVFTGFDHLEGQTLDVLADGAEHPAVTVSSGSITLTSSASVVQAGLGTTWRIKPQRLEAGARDGTAQNKTKRIDQATILLDQSLGVKIGYDDQHSDEVAFRSTNNLMDLPVPLFTGDLKLPFQGQYAIAGDILLSGTGPHPATVVSIVPRMASAQG